jgi:hypothetical protein
LAFVWLQVPLATPFFTFALKLNEYELWKMGWVTTQLPFAKDLLEAEAREVRASTAKAKQA